MALVYLVFVEKTEQRAGARDGTEHTVASAKECAQRCCSDETCGGFDFERRTERCIFSTTEHECETDLQHEPQSDHYRRKNLCYGEYESDGFG